MPDGLVQQVFVARTPQDFWAAILSAMYAWRNGYFVTDWAFEVVVDDIGPGIEFQWNPPDTPFPPRWRAVWDDATWQTPLPTRPWASYPNTTCEIQTQISGLGPGGGDWVAWWDALMGVVQLWFYLATDAVSVTILDGQLVVGTDGEIELGTIAILLDSGEAQPTYIIWSLHNRGVYTESEPTYYVAGNATLSPAVSPTNVSNMIGASVDRIADALEVISLNDQEVSINHNAAMWSINGKVRVG